MLINILETLQMKQIYVKFLNEILKLMCNCHTIYLLHKDTV